MSNLLSEKTKNMMEKSIKNHQSQNNTGNFYLIYVVAKKLFIFKNYKIHSNNKKN